MFLFRKRLSKKGEKSDLKKTARKIVRGNENDKPAESEGE